jgi:acyl dehydratase
MPMHLLVRSLPLEGGIMGASLDELRWPRHVRPEDMLRIRNEVIELRP